MKSRERRVFGWEPKMRVPWEWPAEGEARCTSRELQLWQPGRRSFKEAREIPQEKELALNIHLTTVAVR